MRINIIGTIIGDSSELFYEAFGVPHTSVSAVRAAAEQAERTGQALDVYINSGGGEIFAASEMYAILNRLGNTRIHVDGIAASAASVLMCAGYCDIAPTAMVMVHNVSSYAEGDHRTMTKEAEVLKTACRAVAAAYVKKTGIDEKQALALMDRTTWMTAQEAVDLGLADSISGELEAQKSARQKTQPVANAADPRIAAQTRIRMARLNGRDITMKGGI